MAEDGSPQLQFDRIESAAPATPPACSSCQRTLPDVYYESAGKLFCAPCKDSALVSLTGGSRIARLLKALVLGSVAAAISAAVWYGIIALTGYEIGLVAIVVGFAVGVAVRIGSEARGGWAYQTIAVVLTYLAIGASYVPLVMPQVRQDLGQRSAASSESAPGESEAASDGESEGESAEASPKLDGDALEVAIFVTSVFIGFSLPILQVMEGGVIGLLIVAFALYQAWKLNKRQTLAFTGPFRVEARAPASAV